MSSAAQLEWPRPALPPEPAYPLTVEQYYQLLDEDQFPADAQIELLEGWLIPVMPKPPHDVCVGLVGDVVTPLVPKGWSVRLQMSVRLSDSVPLPDGAVVRGGRRDYLKAHPRGKDIGLILEVSDTTLHRDLGWKKRIYARARIPHYWVVNLPERRIEVFSEPTAAKEPSYRKHRIYNEDESVPFVLEGRQIALIAVADLLP